MELDIIALQDGLYSLYPMKVKLTNMMDCFDHCDVIREKITTYLEDRNRHIIKGGKLGGAEFFGCMCK